jgi:hypothetical protein
MTSINAMDAKLRKDILQVIKTVEKFVKEDNVVGIRNWSDHIIHSAIIYQDKHSIKTAVMVYALSNVLGDSNFREKYKKEFLDFRERVLVDLEKAIFYLDRKDIGGYEAEMVDILRAIARADAKFSEHLGVVLRKAKIVKGGWMHHHGISLGRITKLLGITKWELMRKVGGMKEDITEGEVDRLEMAREFFGDENA